MENVAINATQRIAPYEYAVASRAFAGQRQSGDAALVCATAEGVLIAVIDALGHGDEAAAAADVAVSTLRENAGQPLATLFQRCHEKLLQMRGAAMAMALLDDSSATLSWCGVGNVEGILVAHGHAAPGSKRYLTSRGGVVGYKLPALIAGTEMVSPGDLLIFATDGIGESFVSDKMPHGSPYRIARAILDRHGKAVDDALVLVLRWLGPAPGDVSESVP